MTATKRTYVLPKETLEEFERNVAPRQRSAVITSLLKGWLEEQQRQKLRQALAEGLEDMADVYAEVEQDFHAADEELHRAIPY